MPRVLRWCALVVAAAVLAGCSSDSTDPAPAPTSSNPTITPAPSADPSDTRPTAIVAMGDSEAAGTGGTASATAAGGPGACRRSDDGWLLKVRSDAAQRVVLACSGATAQDVGNTGALGSGSGNFQVPQAAELATAAAQYRITSVVVQVGANDAGFSAIVAGCTAAFAADRGPSCEEQLGGDVAERITAVTSKVDAALASVRSVMTDAGYAADGYQLLVLSYGSPFSEQVPTSTQVAGGCPLRTDDLAWVRTTAVPALTTALRTSATDSGADFLDLSTSMAGHEACTGGADPTSEWQNRMRAAGGSGAAFHPTTAGYAEIARLLAPALRP